MSVPVSPKFPTILRDLVDNSKRVPDIDLSNVGGGGYPIEHVTLLDGNGKANISLSENTYIIVDNKLTELTINLNPFYSLKENESIIYTDLEIDTLGKLGVAKLYKNVQCTIDGVETTMKYIIEEPLVGKFFAFNEDIDEPIKNIYTGLNINNLKYDGQYVINELTELDEIIFTSLYTFNFMFKVPKLKKDNDCYIGETFLMGMTMLIKSTKPTIEFGDTIIAIPMDFPEEALTMNAFLYKKPDKTKVNEYIVEFSADSIIMTGEVRFNGDEPPMIGKDCRTVLSIVNGICAYLTIP